MVERQSKRQAANKVQNYQEISQISEDRDSDYSDSQDSIEQVQSIQPKALDSALKRGKKKSQETKKKEQVKQTNAQSNGKEQALQKPQDIIQLQKEGKTFEALAGAINIATRDCGVYYQFQPKEVQEQLVEILVKDMIEALQQGQGVDLLKSSQKSNQAQLKIIEEFWMKFIESQRMQDLSQDEQFFEKFCLFVISICTCGVRQFRLIGCVIAKAIVTGVIDSIINFNKILGDMIETKGARNKEVTKLKEKEHTAILFYKNVIELMIQSVFTRRYRDICDEVRRETILGIGLWIGKKPDIFLTDQYLKYLAWALSDKDEGVRVATLRRLTDIYKQEHKLALNDFTTRFKSRMVQMTADVSNQVIGQAIKLVDRLIDLNLLDEQDFVSIYKLVGDDSSAIRQQSAGIILKTLDVEGERMLDSLDQKNKTLKKGKNQKSAGRDDLVSKEGRQLCGLIKVMDSVLKESEQQQEFNDEEDEYTLIKQEKLINLQKTVVQKVVDALFERAEVLSNWQFLLASLQKEDFTSILTEDQYTCLLYLIQISIKKLHQGQQVKKGKGRKAQESLNDGGVNFGVSVSLQILSIVPQLIRENSTDANMIGQLVKFFELLDLETMSLEKQQQSLEGIMELLLKVFQNHQNINVILACSMVYRFFLEGGTQILKEKVQQSVDEVLDNVSQKLLSQIVAIKGYSRQEIENTVSQNEIDVDQNLSMLKYSLYRTNCLLFQQVVGFDQQFENCTRELFQIFQQKGTIGFEITTMNTSIHIQLVCYQVKKEVQQIEANRQDGSDEIIQQKLAIVEEKANHAITQVQQVFEKCSDIETKEHIFKLLLEYHPYVGVQVEDEMLDKYWEFCRQILDTPYPQSKAHNIDYFFWENQSQQDIRKNFASSQEVTEYIKKFRKLRNSKLSCIDKLSFLFLCDHKILRPKQAIDLGQKLITCLTDHDPGIQSAVQEFIKDLKKGQKQLLVDICQHSVFYLFERISEDELIIFQDFCHSITNLFTGQSVHRQILEQTVRKGIQYVFQNLKQRIKFIEYGLVQYCEKLTGEESLRAIQLIHQNQTQYNTQLSNEETITIESCLQVLQSRSQKGRGIIKKVAPQTSPKSPLIQQGVSNKKNGQVDALKSKVKDKQQEGVAKQLKFVGNDETSDKQQDEDEGETVGESQQGNTQPLIGDDIENVEDVIHKPSVNPIIFDSYHGIEEDTQTQQLQREDDRELIIDNKNKKRKQQPIIQQSPLKRRKGAHKVSNLFQDNTQASTIEENEEIEGVQEGNDDSDEEAQQSNNSSQNISEIPQSKLRRY